jgi:hypothetical protein
MIKFTNENVFQYNALMKQRQEQLQKLRRSTKQAMDTPLSLDIITGVQFILFYLFDLQRCYRRRTRMSANKCTDKEKQGQK